MMLRRNNVSVGIEKDGGETRVRAGPFEENKRFSLDELQGLGMEREGLSLRDDEIGGFIVFRVWLCGVDLEVALKPGDDRRIVNCCDGGEEKRENKNSIEASFHGIVRASESRSLRHCWMGVS